MITFLEETLAKIKEETSALSELVIILPSKRACGFLLNHLKSSADKTFFPPKISSIEEFIQEISNLKIIDPTELLFESYKVYLKVISNQEKDSFEVYSSWATPLLNDFNEIDRHLISTNSFFNYLSTIKNINHWGVQNEQTQLVKNYLKFWNSLPSFYDLLRTELIHKNQGYQGLIYREAAENIEYYKSNSSNKTHIFIGFNALNTSEQTIIQELLEVDQTRIYWDIDQFFYNDKIHNSSYFIRKYMSTWSFFKSNPIAYISNNYSSHKNIDIIEAQKNISQVKYIGDLLSKLNISELNQTAVVLADENLLIPLLHSIPKNVEKVNITMGISLKQFPITDFFILLITLHNPSTEQYHFKDVVTILNHPITSKIYPDSSSIIERITANNLTYLSIDKLLALSSDKERPPLRLLFSSWNNNSARGLSVCLEIIDFFKNTNSLSIERAALYQVFNVFKKIEALNNKFEHFTSVKIFQQLFSEIINTTTIDYQGDAYNGLQIMGVLETRVLDFKNIIVASLNEGVLPSGKSNNSYITNDLKKEYHLPTYTEKDAIYTYHFFRLLHRAKNITLLYNNFSDGLSTGEKSRFISQIEFEENPRHKIRKSIISPAILNHKEELRSVEKTDDIIQKIKQIAKEGFSPSSLTSYIRNPIDFYLQRVLKINQNKTVEETVAANTLGTIVHDTLEVFYKPLEGKNLKLDVLEAMKIKIASEIEKQFKKTYRDGIYDKGKNLIIFEVAKQFILNFINYEINDIKKGNEIRILKIESKLAFDFPPNELDSVIRVKGKVDRMDEYNGTLRIIDYKTGVVEPRDLEISDWDTLTSDYKYSKALQVLAYALMANQTSNYENIEAGIISFKRLKKGFIKFTYKGAHKQTNISQDVLDKYTLELRKLILEISNKVIPFNEKEV
ncbi:MAG: PD-(D/E)XK nuclease family protein [Flavobacteriaceae bacterium]|nr:PD-(D/E)XK nuclease family protein [Flavobacteriaceae bacterium]